MEVVYIAETSLRNKSAYSQHVIKMCDAFAQNDTKLTLFVPKENKNLTFNKLRKQFLLNSKKGFLIESILKYKINNSLSRIIFAFKASKLVKKKKTGLNYN